MSYGGLLRMSQSMALALSSLWRCTCVWLPVIKLQQLLKQLKPSVHMLVMLLMTVALVSLLSVRSKLLSWPSDFSMMMTLMLCSVMLPSALERAKKTTVTSLARSSLRASVKTMFPAYRLARHNLMIMNALSLAGLGWIRFLVIQAPPRHGKTELTSVQLPTWILGRRPQSRIVLASYSQQLSVLNSRRIRENLRSPAFRAAYGANIRINEEKGSEREWETNKGGGVRAVGVGSGLTGYGADFLIIDDPVKDAEEARSSVLLENIWQWYVTVARTRLQPGGVVIIIMTRWAVLDLVGRLLQLAKENERADQWYVLHLAALALQHDPLGRELGQALWPESYPRKDLLGIRALDEKYFDALYQQEPLSEHEIQFEVEKVRVEPLVTSGWNVVRSWDIAITEDEVSDYSVGALVAGREISIEAGQRRLLLDAKLRIPHELHLADIRRKRATWPHQREFIIQTAMEDGPHIPIILEYSRLDLAAVQDVQQRLRAAGFRVRTHKPVGDKVSRKANLAAAMSWGMFSAHPTAWTDWLRREFEHFPSWSHDDGVDAIEQAEWVLTHPLEWRFAVV